MSRPNSPPAGSETTANGGPQAPPGGSSAAEFTRGEVGAGCNLTLPNDDTLSGDGKMPEASSDVGPQSVTFVLPHKKKRKSKTKVERDASKGGKAGAKDRFHGAQFEYLEGHLEAYVAIPVSAAGRKSADDTTAFWDAVKGGFWEKFAWEDCKPDIGEKAKYWSEGQVVDSTNASIEGWYRYRDKVVKGNVENPWSELLKALRAPPGRAPRQLPAWQVWMAENSDQINARCDERKARGLTAHIGDRNKIARELFQNLSEEEQKEYETSSKQRFDEESAKFAADQAGSPSKDPEVQAE
ncbi:hypothetical protein EIP86_010298 [Pleurotus ostreatoroseus]|nr:hypothetical protein EIP86_010298 [Pleurotus ostreatoroseus]